MKTVLTLFLALISLAVLGQDEIKKEIKKELKIENTDGKYKVTIVTTENGETTTVTKTYDSLEEMQNDPTMGDMKIFTMDNKEGKFMFFNDMHGEEEHEKDIQVIVKKGSAGDIDPDHESSPDEQNTFVFRSGDDNQSEVHKIKVWVDEKGVRHISKDGVEIEGDSWTSKNGKTFDIKKMDGKVMFLSEDQAAEFITEDGKHIDVKVDIHSESGDVEKEMIFVEAIVGDENGEGEREIVVKIVEELKIHLKEIEENEFSEMPGIDAKALKLDDFNYYPNPSSGQFTLAFQADKKPTEIKIINVNGKEVYAERLQSFEGTYKKEIDLSGQQPGIYLLQVLQGKRAMNKKIVIE